jgi:hypothetical protein
MGFVDPVAMLSRFWSVEIAGVVLPDELMALCQDIKIDESLTGKNEHVITFLDSPDALRSNEQSVIESLADWSTENDDYLFEIGKTCNITLGHNSNNILDSFRFIISDIKSTYPEGSLPTLTLSLRDEGFRLQWGRSSVVPKDIKKLSELVIPLANHYKMGYYIDDEDFSPSYDINRGKYNDLQILTRVAKDAGRVLKIIRNTIWAVRDNKVFTDKTDDFRYQLCYRCGDNSLMSVTTREKPKSSGFGGMTTGKSEQSFSGIDMFTGQSFNPTEDPVLGVSGNPDWLAEQQRQKQASTTVWDESVRNKLKNGDISPETADSVFYGPNQINEARQVQYRLDPELPEVLDKNANNPDHARRIMGGMGRDHYDADARITMLDPALTLGVAVKLFGLGHRNNGVYHITGRTINMSQSSGPTLDLKLKRGLKPAPSGKKEEPPKDESVKDSANMSVPEHDGLPRVEYRENQINTVKDQPVQRVNPSPSTTDINITVPEKE